MQSKYLKLLKGRARRMRMYPTPEERIVGRFLKDSDIPHRKQKIIAPYITDFLLWKKSIVIEVDGDHHDADSKQLMHDYRRDLLIMALGISVFRIKNSNLKKMLPKIKEAYDNAPNKKCLRRIASFQHRFTVLEDENFVLRLFTKTFIKTLGRKIRGVARWHFRKKMIGGIYDRTRAEREDRGTHP
jgi:very-short-patch-repair endonuclease